MSAIGALGRFRDLGGQLFLEGEKIRYRIPAGNAEARRLLADIRPDRDALAELLREEQSTPPSLAQITAMLPPHVRLLSYWPKETPFAVSITSVVTNAGKFYTAYLTDLARRLQDPRGYHTLPLADILAKLREGGLELEVVDPR
jgi:hypothetical protein